MRAVQLCEVFFHSDLLRYTDHVSTLKFIEANWGLSAITARSRENLPNSITPFERIPLVTFGQNRVLLQTPAN